jgi:phosphoadenosine phosphosulfate reductase
MAQHNIPHHSLADSYVTMGNRHSTALAEYGVEAESTRYGGQEYECGLHE